MNKRFNVDTSVNDHIRLLDNETNCFYIINDDVENIQLFCNRLNELYTKKEDLKRLNKKRKRKLKVLRYNINRQQEALYGHNLEIKSLQNKLNKIVELTEDTGALTKRQLEEVLNG